MQPRSWLFVPADSEKKVAKALDSEADAIIFDLEDSVAPAQKAAAKSEFKKPLVNSCFTFSLLVGISVHDTTLGVLVANLGFDKVRLPAPVFAGDTLHCESECIDRRESKSRPNAGIVTWAHRAFNQRGELVCEMTRTALIKRRPQ